jgi:hypothetical protein
LAVVSAERAFSLEFGGELQVIGYRTTERPRPLFGTDFVS